MDLIYWSVHSYSRRGGENVEVVDRGYQYFLASCEYYFVRVHENLVQHPSNNISIVNVSIAQTVC